MPMMLSDCVIGGRAVIIHWFLDRVNPGHVLRSISLFSQKGKLYELLIRFILSLMQHFSRGASICITKMLQCDTLSTILSAVDCNTSALFVYDSAES